MKLQLSPAGSISGSATTGQVTFWASATVITGDNGFFYDNTNKRVGIGTTSPTDRLHVSLPVVGANAYMKLSSATASTFHTYFGTTASNQYAWLTNHRFNPVGSTWISDDITRGAWRMTSVCETVDANSIFDIDFWIAGAPNTGYSVFYINGLGQPTFPKITSFSGGTLMATFDVSGNMYTQAIPSGITPYSIYTLKSDGTIIFYPPGADTDTDRAAALLSALSAAGAGDKVHAGVGRFDASAGANQFTVPDLVDLEGEGEDKTILVNSSTDATLLLTGRHTISNIQVKPELAVSGGTYDTAIGFLGNNTTVYLRNVKTIYDVFGFLFSKNVDGKVVYVDDCSFNGQVFGVENDGSNTPINLTIYVKDSSISVLGATGSDFVQAIAVPAYQNTTITLNDCEIVARNGGTTETSGIHAFESCTVRAYDCIIDVSSATDDGGKVSSVWVSGDSAIVYTYGGKMSTTGLEGADYQDLYETNSVSSIYVQGGQGSLPGGAYKQTCATPGVITFAYETPGLNFEEYRAVTAGTTFTLYDYCINSTSGANTINLPDTTSVNIPIGKRYEIKNRDTGNNVTLSGNGVNIDGSATQTILGATRQSMTVRWTGTEWIII